MKSTFLHTLEKQNRLGWCQCGGATFTGVKVVYKG